MWHHIFKWRGFQSSLLWSVSENPHNSWTLWDIWIKFCIQYLFILILSSHWYAKWWQGLAEHHFGRSRYFHNSWTAWYMLIKFCILIHLNIIKTQVWKTVTRLQILGRNSASVQWIYAPPPLGSLGCPFLDRGSVVDLFYLYFYTLHCLLGFLLLIGGGGGFCAGHCFGTRYFMS